MLDTGITPIRVFSNAARFIEAYHRVLQPLCRESGLPPMALDILLYVANNPQSSTATQICENRGFKSAIVSVHIDRLVRAGLLCRSTDPADRRKTCLCCTEKAQPLIVRGRTLQQSFGKALLAGLSPQQIEIMHACIAKIDANMDVMLAAAGEEETNA